jgi:hypothetical protein
MIDPYVLLGMMALLPLLEAVNSLIEFAQRRDIFICDFVAALETCHNQLFTYYMNQDTRWRRDDFHSFNQLIACSHESILLKWDANLNLQEEHLCFIFGNSEVAAVDDIKTDVSGA